ncbi:MAG: GrpB family protein [Bacteroidales bacterium]|nr:GrpB family protein [Bacteroidales bacterium]
MPNGTYGGVRGEETKVGQKTFVSRPTRFHFHRCGDRAEICFRDYLIAHPDLAREYEALKLSLIPAYTHNRDGYTEAKSDFVSRVLALAKS